MYRAEASSSLLLPCNHQCMRASTSPPGERKPVCVGGDGIDARNTFHIRSRSAKLSAAAVAAEAWRPKSVSGSLPLFVLVPPYLDGGIPRALANDIRHG